MQIQLWLVEQHLQHQMKYGNIIEIHVVGLVRADIIQIRDSLPVLPHIHVLVIHLLEPLLLPMELLGIQIAELQGLVISQYVQAQIIEFHSDQDKYFLPQNTISIQD